MQQNEQSVERQRRWRLVLGEDDAGPNLAPLEGVDLEIDQALAELYGSDRDSKRAGLGSSAPKVARWLGDVRRLFPASVVQVLQNDALDRLDLKAILKQPELIKAIAPDVHFVAKLLALKSVLPSEARETAREVVRTVVNQLLEKLAEPTRRAVAKGVKRALRTRRPRHPDIDWERTIRANLKHYQPSQRTIVAERLFGRGRARPGVGQIVLCVDQSGSMATSVVYAGIFASVLASIPSVATSVVAYDTSVVDLTAELADPVDLLFGIQLGGGTDTSRALTYVQTLFDRPNDAILVLVTDLYDGEGSKRMIELLASFVASGVQVVVLVALSDDGAPSFDHENARAVASLGVPVFACTPDLFPDFMAAALERRDLQALLAERGVAIARGV